MGQGFQILNNIAESNIKFESQIFVSVFSYFLAWNIPKGKYLSPNIEYSLEWHKDLTSSLSPWQIWKGSQWENA